MISTDILIVGGGAAGLLAALVCKDAGKEVMVLEGGPRVAKKILVTGNGRCNITNEKIQAPFLTFHSFNPHFYDSVLKQFSVQDTTDLFNYYGVQTTTLDEGKMYPLSLQASSVVDILRMNLEERSIPVHVNSKVANIKKKAKVFLVETTNKEIPFIHSNKVLIATGGKAAPNTGSNGSMFGILKTLGHHIIEPLPSLVPLKLDFKHLKAIKGVRFDAKASVYINNELKREEIDEVLFTDYGISGPAILQLSYEASIGLHNKQSVEIELDLFPEKSQDELIADIEAHFAMLSHRSIYHALISMINKKLIPVLLKESGIKDIHTTCDQISYQDKQKFYQLLKHWRFICIGTTGFKNAQTTIGGVDTKEVNSDTLESKKMNNLFLAGEVLDVCGDCGGYNLQWAWSSGVIAAQNISKK